MWREKAVLLNSLGENCFTEKATLVQRPAGHEGTTHADIQGRSNPDRHNSSCECPAGRVPGVCLRPVWLEQNEHGKHKLRLEGKHQGPSEHTGHCAHKNFDFDPEGHGRSCHETGAIWLAFELDLFGCCAENNLKDNDKSRDLVKRLDPKIQVVGDCAQSHIHGSGRVSFQT